MRTMESPPHGASARAVRPWTARTLTVILLYAGLGGAAEERVHLVIPVAPGGGVDGTAREVGRSLEAVGLADAVSFENMGGGADRALGLFVENAARFRDALLVHSTPLVIRNVQGLFPLGFRDLTPVAGLIADYGVFVVRTDAPVPDWGTITGKLAEEPTAMIAGGGSARGSLDHLVLALALGAAGADARRVRYLPYDGGGKAMLALLGGEVDFLSTGLGETLSFLRSNQVRALAVTAPARVAALPAVPTLTELGHPVTFANWRGAFAALGAPAETRAAHLRRLRALVATDAWQAALDRHGWQRLELFGADFEAYLREQESVLRTTLTDLGFAREGLTKALPGAAQDVPPNSMAQAVEFASKTKPRFCFAGDEQVHGRTCSEDSW